MNEHMRYHLAISLTADRMGSAPKSGKHSEEFSRGRQDGWNHYDTKLFEKAEDVDDFLSTLPEIVLEMLSDERMFLSPRNYTNLLVLCNDLFFWACADCQPFDLSDLDDINRSLEESPDNGSVLWVARKRKMRPQKPYYKYFTKGEGYLFDACGPERDV